MDKQDARNTVIQELIAGGRLAMQGRCPGVEPLLLSMFLGAPKALG